MKIIPLTQGKSTIIDDDYGYLSKYKWHYRHGYAMRREQGKFLYMHRIIINTPSNMFTDHINGNTLDNRKDNLRICTKSENNRNRGMGRNNKSGLKGVTWHKYDKKWQAQITIDNKNIYLGKFVDKFEAFEVYNNKAKELFGEYVRNFLI